MGRALTTASPTRSWARVGPLPAALDRAVRVVALLVFTWSVYAIGYLPASQADPYFDFTYTLANTVRAANDGYPFAAYSQRDPTHVIRIDQFANGYYDPGLPTLISATSLVGRAIAGDGFQVSKQTIYQILLGLFVLTGMVLCTPALPLPVSLGALAALAASILIPVGGSPLVGTSGFHAFSWPLWWEAFGAILVGMLVVGLLTARGGAWRLCYFVGLGVLASYTQFLRHEIAVTSYAALGGLLGVLLGLWCVARWWVRSPSVVESVGRHIRRTVVVGGLWCLGLAVAPYVLRATIALTWDLPYADIATAVHGVGHSLYISLGYVPNPYTISWRDQVATSHSHLIDPSIRVEDPRYLDVLRTEALRIMRESPWLVAANLVQKTRDAATRLSASPPLIGLAGVAVVVTVCSLGIGIRWRSPRLLALLGGLVGLAAGASAPALLIHPDYLFGIQATFVLLAFVVLPAVLAVARADAEGGSDGSDLGLFRQTRAVADRTLLVLGIGALVVGAAGAGWYALRAARYANELATVASSPSPLDDLQRDGFRYAHYFNDLPVDGQARVIAALAATDDPRVGRPEPAESVEGFRPVLAIFTSHQLHVFAWLGRGHPLSQMPFGSALAFVGFCLDCETMRDDLPNDPYGLQDAQLRLDVAAIHNQSWADRYEMLSIPIPSASPPTGEVRIALQTIASDNRTTFTFGLRTDGGWRVRFSGRP